MDYHEMSRVEDVNYRKSGWLLTVITAVFYVFLAIRGKHHPVILVTAVVLGVCAWYEAVPLRKGIDLLIRLGNFMHRFTNPLVFGLVYIGAVMPTTLILRLLGKDVLNLRYDRKIPTYWITRADNGTWKESFRKQY